MDELRREEHSSGPAPAWMMALVIGLLFLTIGPTLSKIEFGRTLENLNVATALEARRDGHWFVPTLERQPRTKKPPLTAWITALVMSPQTVAECSSRDASVRKAAFKKLAFEARWPALLQAGLTLLAVYHLGRIVGGKTIGLIAAMVCASSYLFIRYSQVAVTDVPLMLWVTTANMFIAMALFERRLWLGCLGAGMAIGLAFLAKGPIAFLATVAPLIVWRLWRLWNDRARQAPLVAGFHEPSFPLGYEAAPVHAVPAIEVRETRALVGSASADGILGPSNTSHAPTTASAKADPTKSPSSRSPQRGGWVPILIGVLVCLLVALPWYMAVLLRDPAGQWKTWFKEVTGTDAPERGDRAVVYAMFLVLMLFPWISFWLGGLWLALNDVIARRDQPRPTRLPHLRERFAFLFFLILVPLVAMLFFKDKKDRYLLPLIGSAAVLTARCIVAYFSERPRDAQRDWVGWLHWGVLAGIGIGLPVLGSIGVKALRTMEGRTWYSLQYAAVTVALAGLLLAAGLWTHVMRRRGMVFITFLLMLLIGDVFMHGYRETKSGRSTMRPLAEKIWEKYPDADVYTSMPFGQRASVDLSIYANRPTGWITLEEMTRPSPRARIVLMPDRDAQSAPPGWELLWTAPQSSGGAWKAFARDGESTH